MPRHIRGDSVDGLNCGTRNCGRVLGNSVSKNRSRGKISVKFLPLKEQNTIKSTNYSKPSNKDNIFFVFGKPLKCNLKDEKVLSSI